MKKSVSVIISIFVLLLFTSCGERNECCEKCSCYEKAISESQSQVNLEVVNESKEELEDEYEPVSITTSPSSSKDTPIINIDSDDLIIIAKEYLRLLDSKEWNGFNTTYKNFEVSTHHGEIYINNAPTGIMTNERIFYDKVKDYYFNGGWDGRPTILDGHRIERSKSSGYLTVDGYLSCAYQENWDLPEKLDDESLASNYQYIPYYGTAVIDNQALKMYVRGELLSLSDATLVYEGIDLEVYTPVEYFLRYYEDGDKLFLIVSAIPNELIAIYGTEYYSRYDFYYTKNSVSGVKQYLYIFPNPTVSQVELVAEIDYWTIYGSSSSSDTFGYTDISGNKWEFQSSIENYGFVQVDKYSWE